MAYDVFLVEDEIVVREGIRNKVLKDNVKFNLCGEASDGEMALSMIHDLKPDIVITDIKMPFMNGLELSKIIRKTMPWIKIVILSGYDEFDFAKEAISLGITEYLVKPIASEELLSTLENLATIIEEENIKRMNMQILLEEAKSATSMKREKIFTDFVLGLIPSRELIDYANDNNLNFFSKYYQVIIVEADIQNNDYKEYLKVKTCIEYISENRDDIIFFRLNSNQIVLIMKSSEYDSTNDTSYQIATSIKYEIERQTNCLIKIALGKIVERLAEVYNSYISADKVIKYMNIVRIHKILDSNVLTDNSAFELARLDNVSISDKIKHATKADIPTILEEYLKNINDDSGSSLLMTHYIYTEVLLFASRLIMSLGGDPQNIFPNASNHFTIISEITSKQQLKDTILDILNKTIDFRDSCDELKYGSIIRTAKEFIESNYDNSDLTLKSVAKVIALSPNHFSAIFSQETGETFIEYLTKVRVQKAKEFLKTTEMRSSDIAFSVGYREAHYFSYIFKKHTGLTPREYRNKTKRKVGDM